MSLIIAPTNESIARPNNDSIYGEKGSLLYNSTRKSKLQEAVVDNTNSFQGLPLIFDKNDDIDEEIKEE